MRVLVVKPSSLGDIVHTFPAVSLLRHSFPDAAISWVAKPQFVSMVRLLPAVDDVISMPVWGKGLRFWGDLGDFLTELRKQEFDVVLDFQGLLRSGLISRLARCSRRVGFATAREGAPLFYTEKVLLPANLTHALDKNVFLVRSAFEVSDPVPAPRLDVGDAGKEEAARLTREYGLDGDQVLAVAPASRWESKTWPPSFFAAVLDAVTESRPNVTCWLLGTAGEVGVADAVRAACRVCEPANLAGKTGLGGLVELLGQSDALVTNDSGPMHIAAYLQTPTVALFGPTDPELTGPYGDVHSVCTGECEMMPCFSKRCPLPSRACVTSMESASAARAVLEILDRDA